MQENLYKIPANTKFIGKKIIYLPSCHSTNDIAAGLLAQTEEGAVVITSHQTAGKGQRGNPWEAEANANLTFSIILKPMFLPIQQQFYLNIAVALAIADALKLCLGTHAQNLKLKWSNDIYFQDYKLGGVLIENTLESAHLRTSVVGIGINVNQEQFTHAQAISLKNILQKPLVLAEVLEHILNLLEMRYIELKQQQYEKLKIDYINTLYWFQEERQFQDPQGNSFTGKIIGVEESGKLMIATQAKVNTYYFKEVIFLG